MLSCGSLMQGKILGTTRSPVRAFRVLPVHSTCSLCTFSGFKSAASLSTFAPSQQVSSLQAVVQRSVQAGRGRGTRLQCRAMFERFTEKAIKVVMLAQEEARRLGHNFVGTEQLLLGLIGESTGIAAKVLKSMGVNLKDARTPN